jgi:hypothetical protein
MLIHFDGFLDLIDGAKIDPAGFVTSCDQERAVASCRGPLAEAVWEAQHFQKDRSLRKED